MSRLSLENLERRELFHAASLVEALDSPTPPLQSSECPAGPPAVVLEAADVAVAAGDVNGDGLFEMPAGRVASDGLGTLGFSWGETNDSTHEVVARTGGQDGEERTFAGVDGRVGPGAGDATPLEGFVLPYIEQDNLHKQVRAASGGIADGTSNTMMRLADGSTGLADVGEHTSSTNAARPEANGIIAILIGLHADPPDPSGEAPSTADRLLGEEPIYYPASSQVVFDTRSDISSPPLILDESFARYDDGLLDEEALVAVTLAHIEEPAVNSILHEENEFSFPRV